MRFSKALRELLFAPWAEHYLHYHALKPLIVRIAQLKHESELDGPRELAESGLRDAEEAFWLALKEQLDKVDRFFAAELSGLRERFRAVTAQLNQVKALQEFLKQWGLYMPAEGEPPSLFRCDGWYGSRTRDAVEAYLARPPELRAEPLPEASDESLISLAELCDGVDRLREYGMLCYAALCKVLKKHLKNAVDTAVAERVRGLLPTQAFFRAPGLVELICQAEAVVAVG
eukprot:CAMPEP_0172169798 /NCGR_PEP_ID=MMETSP1050-20130122/10907_1 /TAXON_ID=233186 /ORGANISM="Cryptomonas curvata, Strain CCAP979/52" /LENGTH=229 /DNA_ID=CAMNT_0012840899 /DNA_START=151 /DNA_END=836 /DNA_ORIENTATION=-